MWRKTEESKPVPANAGTAAAAALPPGMARAADAPVRPASAPTPVPAPAETVRTIAGVTAEVVSSPGGVLTSTIKIKGEIRGSEDLYVDGEIRGNMQVQGCRVTVGPHGRVVGDIEAREIVVRGKVQGSLLGRDRVEIGRAGELHGDIAAARINIEEGARIHGKAEVLRAKEPGNSRPPEKRAAENLAQPLVS